MLVAKTRTSTRILLESFHVGAVSLLVLGFVYASSLPSLPSLFRLRHIVDSIDVERGTTEKDLDVIY